MNDFSDRLSESGNEFERALLRAGRVQAPKGAKERAWIAASSVAGASAFAASGAAASTASAVAKVGSAATLKAIVAITGAVAVTGVAAYQVAYRAPLPISIAGGLAVASATTHRVAPSRISGGGEPPTPSSNGALEAPAPSPGPSNAVAAQTRAPLSLAPWVAASTPSLPPPPSETGARASMSVSAELAVLDRSHAALAAGEPARALAILDEYMSAFPRGTMGPEATVLRVEALVKAGDRRAAARAAEALLATSPGSPYARRIESLLAMPIP